MIHHSTFLCSKKQTPAKPSLQRRKWMQVVTSLALMLGLPLSGVTADVTWDVSDSDGGIVTEGAGTWDTTVTNWTEDGGSTNVAFVASDNVTFGGGTAGAAGTVSLGESITVGNIIFNAAFGGGTYTIDTGTNVLSFGGIIDANVDATIQSGAGGSVFLTADHEFQILSGATVTVNSDFTSDPGNDRDILVTGGGTLVLNGTNNATNSALALMQIRNGTLQFSNDSNLGDDRLILGFTAGQNGTVDYRGAGESINNDIRLGNFNTNTNRTGSGIILNNGTGNLVFSNNTFNVSQRQNNTITRILTLGGTAGTANTIAGEIRNNESAAGLRDSAVGVTKEGTNTWILNGNNTFTGATLINDGRLDLNGTNTTAITVAAGKTLGGGGSTTGDVSFGAGSIIAADGTGFATSGALDTSAGVVVLVETGGVGAFDVLGYGSKANGSVFGDLSLSGLGIQASGRNSGMATFDDSGTAFTLDLGFANKTWTGAQNGNWDEGSGGSDNWSAGGGDNKFFNGDIVTFDDSVGSNQTVTLTTNVSPGSVTFSNDSDTYTLSGVGSIVDLAGSTTSLTKSGLATVTINTANTYTGGTLLTSRITEISNVAALGTGDITMDELNSDTNNNVELRFIGTPGAVFTNNIVQSNVGNNKVLDFNTTGALAIELSGNISFEDTNGAFRHIISLGDDTVTMSGLLSGISGFDLREAGTLRLTNANNTFGFATGNDYLTIRNDATLEITSISNAGENSALGHSAEIRFGNNTDSGTLSYVGTSAGSTNRHINIGGINNTTGNGGAIIENNSASAAHTLTFELSNLAGGVLNNASNVTTATDRTLTLGGSNTGDNEIKGGIVDNSVANSVGLVKAGAGKWILSGTSTFGGGTTVNEGTLVLGNASDTLSDTGAVTVNGGTLDIEANSDTVGAVTLQSGTIDGSGGVLSGSSYNLQEGTVNAILGGSGALTKTTTGTATINSVSTLSGTTTVTEGTLDLVGSLENSAITVGANGTLKGEGTAASFDTVSGGILSVDGSNGITAFSVTGDFNSSNGVSVLIETAGTGVFTVANFGIWDDNLSDFSLNSGGIQSARATFGSTASSITLDLGLATRTWRGNGGVNNTHWNQGNTTDNNWLGGDNDFLSGDAVIFDNDATTFGIVLQNAVTPREITFTNTTNAYTIDDITAGTETITSVGGINITGSGDVTLNAQIVGNTSITHSGTGTLTLDGNDDLDNTFTGTVVVNSGATLRDGGNSRDDRHALGDASNTITINAGGTFDINGNNSYDKYGTGSFQVSGAGVGGNGAIINTGGQAQEAFDDQLDVVGDVTFGGSGRWDIDQAISTSNGDVTITKVGTNDMFLGANNTASSIIAWVINGGRIGIGTNGAIDDDSVVTVNAGGALRASGTQNQTRTVVNDITLNGGEIDTGFRNNVRGLFTGNINVTAASNFDSSGDSSQIIELTGNLTGSGDLTIGDVGVHLFGNTAGYTGSLTLNETDALIVLGNGNTLAADLTFDNNGDGKMLELQDSSSSSGSGTFSGTLTNNETGNDIIIRASATDTLTISGTVTGNGMGLDINAARTGRSNFDNTVGGTVNNTVDNSGKFPISTGAVILAGDNDYTGTTTISGGTLQIGNGLTGGTLGTGDVTNNAALVFNTSDDNTYAGSISGSGSVTQIGSGATTLSGNNTYTGATTVSSGTLNLGGTNTSAITVANNANLGGEGSTSGNITFLGSHTLSIDASTSDVLETMGTLDLTAVAQNGIMVDITGSVFGTIDVIKYGTAAGFFDAMGGNFTLGSGSVSGRNPGGTFGDTGDTITFDAGFANRTWDNTSGSNIWVSGNTTDNNWVEDDEDYFDGDNVTFDDTPGANQSVTLGGNVTPNSVTFSNASHTYTLDDNGGGEAITGSTALTHNGSGTVAINNANTFSGGTTINGGGLLQVGDDEALGTGTVTIDGAGNPRLSFTQNGLKFDNEIIIGDTANRKDIHYDPTGTGNVGTISGNIQLVKNQTWTAQFHLGNGDTLNLTGVISGPGDPYLTGSGGTLVLSNAANSFSNRLWSGNGTLVITSLANKGVNSAAGSGSFLVVGASNASGTISYTGGAVTTDRQVQVGATGGNSNDTYHTGGGAIENNGTGAMVFEGQTGGFFNSQDTAGTNRVGARTLTLGGSNDDQNEIKTILRDNAGGTSAPINPVNTVNLVKSGSGRWILSGANTYSGTTTVSNGTLLVDGDNSLANGAVTVESGGTFGGGGIIGGATTINGTHTAGTTTNADTQFFNNGLTYNNGSTVVWNLISNSSSGTGGTAGTDWDLFDLNGGALDFNATTNFQVAIDGSADLTNSFWLTNQEWLVYDYSGGSLAPGFSSNDFLISRTGGSGAFPGGSFELVDNMGGGIVLQFTAIPEPSTYALLGLGLAGFGWVVRRRRRKEQG